MITHELQSALLAADVRLPDVVFDCGQLDRGEREERGEDIPLHESRESGLKLAGCYAFVDEGFIGSTPRILYIGKAVRLRNRIQAHWNGKSRWLDRHYDDVYKAQIARSDEFTGAPTILVWFCENRTAFEVELIQKLKPIYNQQTG